MLPPVQAISNSGTSYPDARKQQETLIDVAARPVANPQPAAQVIEQNTAIAGRLNMLLLSGQERMSQNLASLIDLLGRAMKVERNEGESLSGYATRLVQTLASLPPDDRQTVQRQLAQLFGGLQLRTLIEAFRNPVGPEAAMLSIYLELYRNKDRDLAARSAVTSYRQNAGEQKLAAEAAPLPPARTPPQASRSPASETAARPMTTPEEGSVDDVVQPVNRDATARPRADRDASGEAVRNGAKPAAATDTSGLFRNAAAMVAEGHADTDADDIRTLQDRLRHNFDFGDEPAPAPARPAPAPPGEARSASDVSRAVPPKETAQQGAVLRMPAAEPEMMTVQGGLQETADGVADQALNTLRSWKDVVVRTLIPNPAELSPQSAGEGDRDGLATPVLPLPAGVADDDRSPFDAASRTLGMARSEAAQSAVPASAGDELDILTASVSHGARVENPAAMRSEAEGDHAAARQGMMLREGVPLPVINYLMAQNEYVEDEKELRRRYEDEDGENGDPSGRDDESRENGGDADGEAGAQDDAPEEEPSATAERRTDAPVPLLAANIADGLPVADFYQRMADWA